VREQRLAFHSTPLHVMHFLAILRNYSGMTTAFQVSILLKKNHRIAGYGGLAQPQCYIFDQKRTVGVRLTFMGTFEGALHCFCPPGAEDPSYATASVFRLHWY